MFRIRFFKMLPTIRQSLSCQQSNSRISRNFLLTLAMGMTFGFSFAYLLLNVVNWEKIGFNGSTFFVPQPVHWDHNDDHYDPHDHHNLDSVKGPTDPVSFHSHDEQFHKGLNFINYYIIFHILLFINYYCIYCTILYILFDNSFFYSNNSHYIKVMK